MPSLTVTYVSGLSVTDVSGSYLSQMPHGLMTSLIGHASERSGNAVPMTLGCPTLIAGQRDRLAGLQPSADFCKRVGRILRSVRRSVLVSLTQ